MTPAPCDLDLEVKGHNPKCQVQSSHERKGWQKKNFQKGKYRSGFPERVPAVTGQHWSGPGPLLVTEERTDARVALSDGSRSPPGRDGIEGRSPPPQICYTSTLEWLSSPLTFCLEGGENPGILRPLGMKQGDSRLGIK